MQTLEITVSLARAHKVVDRIRERLAMEEALHEQNSNTLFLSGHSGAQQATELIARRPKAASALRAFREWNGALAQVRLAIGRANVSVGVADLLAQREEVQRELTLLKPLVAERPSCIQPEGLVDYRCLSDSSNYTTVSVSLATPAQLEEARSRTEELQKQLFRLGNQLADANHQRITFALPRVLAEQLGLGS